MGARRQGRRGAWTSHAAACLVGALGLVLAAGGAAQVPLPGTQPADGSGAPGFPLFQDGANPGTLEDPGYCANCHAGYRLGGEPIYEPWDSWAGSMMAQAGRDPLFWAALDVANQDDAEHLGDVGVGEWCLRCHVPNAWYEGRVRCTNPWGEPYDGSCLEGAIDEPDSDYEGISCHFCHRMYDASAPPSGEFADPAAPRRANCQVYLTTERDVMRGPYADAQVSAVHTSANSDFHETSAYCGQCHDVTNPVRNLLIRGEDQGVGFPADRTYTEYLQSAFSDPGSPVHATCQDCHMPEVDLDGDGTPDPAYASGTAPEPRGGGAPLEGPLRTHALAGGGVWLLGVLRDEYGAALGREEQFDAGIEASLRLLTERTVDLELTSPTEVVAGGSFEILARVINLAGHKFPSGYAEGRRAWINLVVGQDADEDGVLSEGEKIFESGIYDAVTGVLSLTDSRGEPRIWEAKFGIWDHVTTDKWQTCDTRDETGRKLLHLVLANCIFEDTRIPPLGFVPSIETEPVNWFYPDNPDLPGTLANWDEVDFPVEVPLSTTGELLVQSTVYYQTTTRAYVEFLLEKNQSTCDPSDPGCDPTQPNPGMNRGEKLHDLWQRYGRSPPVPVATASLTVSVLPNPPGEASDVEARALPLRVTGFDRATGEITIQYQPACAAWDHAVYWGDLTDVSSYGYADVACSVGFIPVARFNPGPGSQFFLIAGQHQALEGSYGRSSDGAERPEAVGLGTCDQPQVVEAACE